MTDLILPPQRRLLVAASRKLGPWDIPFLKRGLAPYWRPRTILVHGAEPRGDIFLRDIWESWGGQTEAHPVSQEEWDLYGKKAGPARNARMVNLGADQWVGFPIGDRKESPGTWGCRDLADAAKIPCVVIPYEPRVFTFPVAVQHTEDW